MPDITIVTEKYHRYATIQKVAGSIPDEVIVIFQLI
jgi:hypothetical protein